MQADVIRVVAAHLLPQCDGVSERPERLGWASAVAQQTA